MGYPYSYSRGVSRPLGATVRDDGVNFSLYSESATAVELLLFDRYDDPEPRQSIRLAGRHHRNFNYWHVFIHGISAGQLYGYRVHGPDAPADGMRFNPRKVLIDPYAQGIVYGENWSREEALHPEDNTASSMKSLVVDPCTFDWEGVEPPKIDPTQRVIYELHVRGFTRDPSSKTTHHGTFSALIEKIPYLKKLGVTTVELLPVFQFDDRASIFTNPTTGEPLRDFWGYNPLGFFTTHRGYYIEDWQAMRTLTGFRDMVKAFHKAGLEVFLDVVFNHTAEGGADGPTITFKGIENKAYYQLDPADPSRYADFSGCGNALNCNHPVVRRLILDSLRYWVNIMHVDGFRFDLASILARGQDGKPLDAPPLTWEIECDPALERTTLIAEAWDAAGLYQVGAFPGERWEEWNGMFRDDVRKFWRGDHGMSGPLATRMMGSPDIYEHDGRQPNQGINFITCHDGFTLNDLVSYNTKHNDANGEQGRDGSNSNYSFNYGVEGPTTNSAIEALRMRQIKNMLTTLFLAQGTPMLLAGDEFRRTQQGNNNVWCQDNPLGWIDWSALDANPTLFRFTSVLIAFRKRHPSLRRDRFLLGFEASNTLDLPGYTRVRWHGTAPDQPNWDPSAHTVAYTLTEAKDDVAIHIMLNAADTPITFVLPPTPDSSPWLCAIDTAKPTPHDICDAGQERPVAEPTLIVAARNAVVLLQSPGFKESDVIW